MPTALIRRDAAPVELNAARQALAKASTIADVKAIKDTAEAAEIYAKRQQLGEEAEHLAYPIKVLALGKLGDLLKARRRPVHSIKAPQKRVDLAAAINVVPPRHCVSVLPSRLWPA